MSTNPGRGDECALCATNPARGFASIGTEWYCHGDDDARPTCFERATFLRDGGVPLLALPAMDALWRESMNRMGGFKAHGTRHTVAGLERRKARDRARIRARCAVRDLHRADFEWIKANIDGKDSHDRYNAALRRIAAQHPDDYERAYQQALAEQGYEPESHPCNSVSTATTIGAETSGPGAVSPAPDLPEPGQGNEMAERTHGGAERGNR